MINLICQQDVRSTYAGIYSTWRRDLEAVCPAGATRCTDGVKLTLPCKIPPQHWFMSRTFLL